MTRLYRLSPLVKKTSAAAIRYQGSLRSGLLRRTPSSTIAALE
jgi:hypothetical protein